MTKTAVSGRIILASHAFLHVRAELWVAQQSTLAASRPIALATDARSPPFRPRPEHGHVAHLDVPDRPVAEVDPGDS